MTCFAKISGASQLQVVAGSGRVIKSGHFLTTLDRTRTEFGSDRRFRSSPRSTKKLFSGFRSDPNLEIPDRVGWTRVSIILVKKSVQVKRSLKR